MPEMLQLRGPRFMGISEQKQGSGVNHERLKAIATGDVDNERNLYRDYGAGAPTCVLWIGCNDADLPRLGLDDPAIARRLHILRYPALPKADPEFRGLVKNSPAIRQAIVARLVQRATKFGNGRGPAESPNAAEAKAIYRVSEIGDAGEWLAGAIAREKDARIWVSDVWDAAVAAATESGDLDSEGNPWGLTKAEITKRLRRIHQLTSSKPVRINRAGATRSAKGWEHWLSLIHI